MSKYRKKIVAGNWKMNKAEADAADLAADLKRELAECREVDVVICPPYTALHTVGGIIANTYIKLGAQNMHWAPDGAYTGEISASMLRSFFCHYVILGHSERRAYFGETDEIVNRKVRVALTGNLTPIVCVGETLEEREKDQTEEVLRKQLSASLAGLGSEMSRLIVAYEPVWAIGTGKTASPAQAQDAHAFIRQVIGEMSSVEVAQGVRIQYGGSVKPSNAKELFSQKDIDGGLIGGAALESRSFVEIVKAAM